MRIPPSIPPVPSRKRPLEIATIPTGKVGGGGVAAVEKSQQLLLRLCARAQGLVGKDELGHLRMVVRGGRRDEGGLQSFRFGGGIGVEDCLRQRRPAWPEAVADDLVRIRFAGYRVGLGPLRAPAGR